MRQRLRRQLFGKTLLAGLATGLLASAANAAPAAANVAVTAPGCVFDISALPTMGGKVTRLLPGTNGDIAGALLQNGAEVVLPPGLAAQDPSLRVGVMLNVRGLWSPSEHLIRAFALAGSPALCAEPMPEMVTAAPPVSAEGVVQRLLHDGDGAVNGALLADGTVIRVPAAGARSADLALGKTIYVDGGGYRTAYGKLVRANIMGPSRAQAVRVTDEPLVPRGAAPGSPAYDEISGGGASGGTE